MESLIDRLKSLGVSIGKGNLEITPSRKHPIENVIKGEWIHDPLGDIYQVQEKLPEKYSHGQIILSTDFPFSKVLKLNAIPDDSITLQDILFFDTETTGLSGGTGTMVFLVGLGYFTETGFCIEQYFLDDPSSEMSMMNILSNRLKKHKMLVSYNGSSFDIPLIKTRFIMNRIESPLVQMEHLDLLHLSRKLWRLRLSSLRLKDIENEILKFVREEEEVPGWMVPQIYFDFIRSRDARPLKGVFYHNRMDVLSLAVILNHVSDLISEPLANEEISNLDVLSIARIFERYGFREESAILFQSSLEKGLPDAISTKALRQFGIICRQHDNIEMALKFWAVAAERGDYQAAIELSKYFEHILKDYISAKLWAKSSIKLVDGMPQEEVDLVEIRDKILQRLKRIDKKQSNEKE